MFVRRSGDDVLVSSRVKKLDRILSRSGARAIYKDRYGCQGWWR